MGEKIICWLIEDDVADQHLFKIALSTVNASASLVVFNTAPEALQKLTTETTPLPHFIFVDLHLPVMTGKSFLTEIKSYVRLANIPIIIYTYFNHLGEIADTRSLGAVHYMIKPSSQRVLIDQLRKVLSRNTTDYVLREEKE